MLVFDQFFKCFSGALAKEDSPFQGSESVELQVCSVKFHDWSWSTKSGSEMFNPRSYITLNWPPTVILNMQINAVQLNRWLMDIEWK